MIKNAYLGMESWLSSQEHVDLVLQGMHVQFPAPTSLGHTDTCIQYKLQGTQHSHLVSASNYNFMHITTQRQIYIAK